MACCALGASVVGVCESIVTRQWNADETIAGLPIPVLLGEHETLKNKAVLMLGKHDGVDAQLRRCS